MTKPEIDALGKLMEFEIGSAFDKKLLPPQLSKPVGAKLVEKGLAQEVETTLRGWPPVTVKGYVLTLRGHMVYCMDYGQEPEAEE